MLWCFANIATEIFVKEKMDQIRRDMAKSKELFKSGNFSDAKNINIRVLDNLSVIENICKEAENHKVQAKIYDMHGDVDKQPAGKFTWLDLKKSDNLQEQDKVRTLKESYADIIFKDESHIFLEENSMILIKKMRENRLNKKNSSTMVLVKGDLQALLNSSKAKDFHIDIPDIKTSINSNYFWLQRNKKKDVNISNYDGTIQVASAGKIVNIKKNEGVKVKYKKPPSNPIKLLPSPKNLTSVKNDKGYLLEWDKVKKSVKYQIQVSSNRSFTSNIAVLAQTKTNKFTVKVLKDGVYFWRVRSFDNQGLPGRYSTETQLIFRNNFTKPFILVKKEIFNDSIRISIETQTGNTIFINDLMKIAKKQITTAVMPLKPGKNIFNIKVVSPDKEYSENSFSVVYSEKTQINFSYPKETESAMAEVSGNFSSDYLIKINGKNYRTKNKKFKKILRLNQGLNLFPVEVIDEKLNSVVYSDTLRIFLKK